LSAADSRVAADARGGVRFGLSFANLTFQ